MTHIGMYQSAAEETIPLTPVYGWWIKDQVVDDPVVIETADGNDGRNDDDDKRN